MKKQEKRPVFIDKNGTFSLQEGGNPNALYFPLAGEYGLKSSISPTLAGDAKLDQNHFLYEPVSIENLGNNRLTRNFWCIAEDGTIWSAGGNSAQQNASRFSENGDLCTVTAGYMWHQVERENAAAGLRSRIISFIPYDLNVEVHIVTVTNLCGTRALTLLPAFPVYGRSADNIRDHRHVTSLLGRVEVTERGLIDRPTFSFDERGHKLADAVYYVEGVDAMGNPPENIYPVLDEFVGSGTPDWPETVVRMGSGTETPRAFKPGETVDGQEIIAALRFRKLTLEENASATFVIYAGIAKDDAEAALVRREIGSLSGALESLENTKNYWISKVNIKITTGDPDFDSYMRLVAFQPELRRIFGCSFLPHHDYGKGGRGWRDLWQDCLALLLMDPSGVKQMLLGNFSGTRIDGTNATIIGSRVGEFKADRNSITRVWMDHGVWPLLTTALYIDQTGDASLLLEECGYFRDRQIFRGRRLSEGPEPEGNRQTDASGSLYKGTVLEHLLLQTLTAFWEVGEHNIPLLRDADWNDALDMAGDRGESVAFACAYAGNLGTIAGILEAGVLPAGGVYVLEPMQILLSDEDALYEDVPKKKELLNAFLEKVAGPLPSGKILLDAKELAANLRKKEAWLKHHIAEHEWIEDGEDGWFNGYYDNSGRALDLSVPGKKNMMLTGQVFSVMNGIADEEQVSKICRSADRYLYDEGCGGYRLNTDFGEVKTDMGRMFGFAFGEKENGAVFSHMAVMYANALYQRGFAKEGYKAMHALYALSEDFETSQIYPGIPEYFGRGGRGLYSYLTGAASWYLLTVVRQMFGVRGEFGNLLIEPSLLNKQFDEKGIAGIELEFAGKPFKIDLVNKEGLEQGEYRVKALTLDGRSVGADFRGRSVCIGKTVIGLLDPNVRHQITVILGS